MTEDEIRRHIEENARRFAEKHRDYDQKTGLNCYGKRIEIELEDAPAPVYYIPVEMKALKATALLIKHKSIGKAAAASIGKKTSSKYERDLFWIQFCDARCRFDYEFYAITHQVIRDKSSGRDIAFELNWAQREMFAKMETQRRQERQINVIVCKAKQMGFSTLTEMYFNWIQSCIRTGWNSVIASHVNKASANIRGMYKRTLKQQPPIDGQKLSFKNYEGQDSILNIPERGCNIVMGTANEPDSCRSQDVKLVHFSEMAFWPNTDANPTEELYDAVMSSGTGGKDTAAIVESTPNGYDFFHDMYFDAKENRNSYEAEFAPFCMCPLYETLFDGTYHLFNGKKKKGPLSEFIQTMNEYEWNLWKNDKRMTFENLNWRRWKRSTMSSEAKMRQEYPANDIEAFLDSGDPVFDADAIERLRPDCKKPTMVGRLIADAQPAEAILEPKKRKMVLSNIRFEEDSRALDMVVNGDPKSSFIAGRNKLLIWETPDRDEKVSNEYVVAFDPQKGESEGADYGVIKVFNRYWMQYGGVPEVVAMFYGHLPKDVTIWIAAQVAKWYNNAKLVVESNTYDQDNGADQSEALFDQIARQYSNLYMRVVKQKLSGEPESKYGFHTGHNEKQGLVTLYQTILREHGYMERDAGTLDEAHTYVKNGVKWEAKKGKHDDRIMCTMIGLKVCYDLPTPVTQEERKPERLKSRAKASRRHTMI